MLQWPTKGETEQFHSPTIRGEDKGVSLVWTASFFFVFFCEYMMDLYNAVIMDTDRRF